MLLALNTNQKQVFKRSVDNFSSNTYLQLHFARQGETKGSDEMSAKSIFLVSELGAFTSSDRAVSNYATSKTTPSR